MKKKEKNICWFAVITAMLFVLGSTPVVVSITEDWMFDTDETILITGIDWENRSMIGMGYEEVTIEDETYIWSTELPLAPGLFCGFSDARDEELDTHAEFFVHTYAEEPNIGNFIHCELWMEETRPDREKAYLVTLVIDTWHIDYGWREGIVLGGIIVWEDICFDYQHVGTYGLAKAMADDNTFIFRNKVRSYYEAERGIDWIRFELQETDYADGIWFYDMPPWLVWVESTQRQSVLLEF